MKLHVPLGQFSKLSHSAFLYVKYEFAVYPLLTRCQHHMPHSLLQTVHYWANAGILLGARVHQRVAFEPIKLIDAKVLSLTSITTQTSTAGKGHPYSHYVLLRRIEL